MEKKNEVSNISKKKKRSLPRSTEKDFHINDRKEYRKLPLNLSMKNSKSSIHKKQPRNSVQARENVEKTNDNIKRIHHDKENNLLNLIVKTIVKSTLEQLYGKESY